jgi:hypothetical protein
MVCSKSSRRAIVGVQRKTVRALATDVICDRVLDPRARIESLEVDAVVSGRRCRGLRIANVGDLHSVAAGAAISIDGDAATRSALWWVLPESTHVVIAARTVRSITPLGLLLGL